MPVDGSVVLSDLTEDDLLAGVLALASVTVRSAPSTPHVSASTILPGMVATADGWPLGDMADLPTARQETDIFVSFSDSNQPDNVSCSGLACHLHCRLGCIYVPTNLPIWPICKLAGQSANLRLASRFADGTTNLKIIFEVCSLSVKQIQCYLTPCFVSN